MIVNRGSRQGQQDLEPALALLRSRGREIDITEASSAEQACDIIKSRRQQVDGIVIGGGDGTLQGVAPALLEAELPLGIIPLGTANDLASALGLPADLKRSAEIIAAGRLRQIDLASANGVLFFNVAHIGLGARVNARLTPDVKRQWGRWSYLRTLLQSVTEQRSFTAILEYGPNRECLHSIQLSVGNGGHYGGGMRIHQAGLDDSLLHVSSVAPANLWKLLGLFLRLRRGAVKNARAVRLLHVPELMVRTQRPMKVSAGGEWICETPVRFRVLPRVLRVYSEKAEEYHEPAK